MAIKFWCPGCDDLHMVSDDWNVTGSGASLTIEPSILIYERQKLVNEDLEWEVLLSPENITTAPRCHSFVRNGHIEFLSDCTHELTGQTVVIPPLPDWLK
jgi:hypothetical protein